MIDEAVSMWASNRLAALGGRLTTQYAGLAELRAAGVAERRIQNLYPFDVAEWYQGIFDLTLDADMGPQPSEAEAEVQSAEQEAVLLLSAHGGVVRETANAITHTLESVTVPMRDLGTAVQDAADPEALAPTADTLRATVLLLNVLTLEGVELKHDRRWAKNFSSFQQLVDELLATLERHRWQSRALRSIDASRI